MRFHVIYDMAETEMAKLTNQWKLTYCQNQSYSWWILPGHCWASLCSLLCLHDENISVATQDQVSTSVSDEPEDIKTKNHSSAISSYHTWGLRWKTWFETARLCSSLNGGSRIPSLTGKVNLSSSSKIGWG